MKGFFAVFDHTYVTADRKFSFISARPSGSTHFLTALQASLLHRVIMVEEEPQCVLLLSDDAHINQGQVLTPYSGPTFTSSQISLDCYHSSCIIALEHSFALLVQRFGTLWSILKYSLYMHSFKIEKDGSNWFQLYVFYKESNMQVTSIVHVQNDFFVEHIVLHNRGRCRQYSKLRYILNTRLQKQGFIPIWNVPYVLLVQLAHQTLTKFWWVFYLFCFCTM